MQFLGLVTLLLTFVYPLVLTQDNREYLTFIDRQADPCDDFYEYACGKWSPSNNKAHNVMNDQKLDNLNVLKEHYSTLKRMGLREDKTSQFYNQCLRSKFQMDTDILQPYLSTLVEITEWPYVNDTFNPSSFDWLLVSAKLRRYQVDTLFQLNVQRSWKYSNEFIIYLSRSRVERRWDEESSFLYEAYVKYVLLGFKVRLRKAMALAREVVDFEVELDKLTSDVESPLSEPISLGALTAEFPDMEWMRYFTTLFGKSLKQSQQIVVEEGYIKKLKTLLSKTKTETIALAQIVRFLMRFGVYMDTPDWQSCLNEVNLRLPLLLSKKFLSLREDSFTPSKVRDIFEAIREEFRQMINATDWYDTTSKQEMLSKLAAVRMQIGYLQSDLRSLREVQIDPENYQKSRMLLAEMAVKHDLDLLSGHSMPGNGKQIEPLNVNAYYRLTTNTLDIPIGILQPPIYREKAGWAQIMGTLGTIIGHELVHGFDYDGQGYDTNGNVRSEISPKPLIQFGVRVKCYIDQYGARVGAAVNEDIADNEGVRLAYNAFKRFSNDKQNITEEQLFFTSFAQVWCQSEDSRQAFRMHSPNKDRVNYVASNSEKFAEAFSCRSETIMNPVKKCRIW